MFSDHNFNIQGRKKGMSTVPELHSDLTHVLGARCQTSSGADIRGVQAPGGIPGSGKLFRGLLGPGHF